MKRIICLHGNPGSTQDWDILKSELKGSAVELIAENSFSDNWIKLVRESNEKVILLGHSVGCAQILKNIKVLEDKVERVILLSPTLSPGGSMSGLQKILLQVPGLNSILLKLKQTEITEKFMENLLFPLIIDDHPYFKAIEARLSENNAWLPVIERALDLSKTKIALEQASKVSGIAFFGTEDKSTLIEPQLEVLKLFPNIQIVKVPHAGHEMIWSRTDLVREAIHNPQIKYHKIGYFPGTDVRNNVIEYLESHLRQFPNRVALRWANKESLEKWDGGAKSPIKHDEVTYKQFAERIISFSAGLNSIGIQKGDRIIIFMPMSLDMYTAMFAVQRIGAIAVFLDSWARSSHLGATAKCVDPKAMISFKQAFDLVDNVPEFQTMPIRVMYGPGENATHNFHKLLLQQYQPVEPVESEFPSLITFTTGSTGTPKGANRTHRFLSAQHHALHHVVPYLAKDIDMPAFPIFSLNNLATGVTTVLPALNLAQPSDRDPAILASQILNQNINCTTLSPSMLVGLSKYCKAQGIQLSELKRVVTGGAPISKDDVRAFYEIAPQSALWILYGSTEAEPMAHIEGREMLKEQSGRDPEVVDEGVNVGQISEDIEYKFIKLKDGPIELPNGSWAGYEVPVGEVGEFVCTGDHVCREYYNNKEAFKSTKILDANNKVWHRTGDLAYLDNQKNVWIVGRVNNAVERSGKYLFPVRAEVLLKRFDFAHRAAFLGLSDDKLGQSTLAAIELKHDLDTKHFDFPAAKEQILRIFEKNKIPLDKIVFVKSIPMDPRHHSKVEYKTLRDSLNETGVILG